MAEFSKSEIIRISLATVSLLTVVPTLVIFVWYRKKLFNHANYTLWRVYLVTRLFVIFDDFYLVGEAHQPEIFCRMARLALLSAAKCVGESISFMLCIYQGLVLFAPIWYFNHQGNPGFHRAWSRAVILCTVISLGAAAMWFGKRIHDACYMGMPIERVNLSVITAALIGEIIGTLFLILLPLITALSYVTVLIISVIRRFCCCKSNTKSLSKSHAKKYKNEAKLSTIGLLSFASSFTPLMMYNLYGIDVENIPTLVVLYLDRAGDPIWHLWRNSTFREQIIRLVGLEGQKQNPSGGSSTKPNRTSGSTLTHRPEV